MASAGVGIDIFEIARMRRALERRPSLARRVFTPEECAYCERSARPAEHYAARFAARKAVLKALELYPASLRCADVSVDVADNGRPQVVLTGEAGRVAREKGITEVALSLSFTHEVATAMALLVSEEVRPAPREERDYKKEFVASFKQARSVLDELDRLQGDVASALE